jgi:glycosyltransferase involved in cell wall biosynthesis
MKQLSIIVPCYNEEEVLDETMRRLQEQLALLVERRRVSPASRVYFVDDGSVDATWRKIQALVDGGRPAVGIKLSRNFGHQNALIAGLLSVPGDAVITIDADLQDDVTVIAAMVDEFERGADIVYGVRRRRTADSAFKRRSAHAFYRLMGTLGAESISGHADFRLLSRRAVDALAQYREVNLYLRGIVPMLGFRCAVVEYDRQARYAGRTKYSLRRMVSLALDAVTSFSALPLRLISALGLFISLGSLATTVWVLVIRLFTDLAIPGWASTVLPIYFLGGIQLLALGVIGEYVGKTYVETKGRPRFFVEARHERAAGGGRDDINGTASN